MEVNDMTYGDVRIDIQVGTTDRGDTVVAGEGDGSLNGLKCLKDRTARSDENYHNERTTFNPKEADDVSKWQRLHGLNHNLKRMSSVQRNRTNRVQLAEAMYSSLPVTASQKVRAKRLVSDIGGGATRGQGGIPALALACMTIVQNRDITDYENRIQQNDQFQRMIESHGVSLIQCLKRVKEHT